MPKMATDPRVKIEVVGRIDDPLYHQARVCAEILGAKTEEFVCETRPMFEFDWVQYRGTKKVASPTSGCAFTENVLCSTNGKLSASVQDFLSWAKNNHSYSDNRPASIFQAMADQARTTYLETSVNTHVYMEISIGDDAPERLVIELFSDKVPKTCENFRALCTGEKGSNERGIDLAYKGSVFHRVQPKGWIQGGDVVSASGNTGDSIYGETFEDENFIVEHSKRGIVAMANNGLHSNASQFLITFRALPFLDKKCVAFGRVLEGSGILDRLENVSTYTSQRPKNACTVVSCGQL